jgi:protein-S-isoprenylcysteine O-methyltransferase Ste14
MEKLNMNKLETLIPPPLIALTFAMGLWGLAQLDFGFSFEKILNDDLRLGASTFFVATGLFFSAAGVISFKLAKTTVNPLKPEQASSLVSSGIYQFSRNPMYVGFCFFLVAISLFLNTLWIVLILPAFMLYLSRFQIMPEERALTKIFGDAYIEYQSHVRRWL